MTYALLHNLLARIGLLNACYRSKLYSFRNVLECIINLSLHFSFSDSCFTFVARNTFWTDLFERYFLEAQDDEAKDDMLFYVRKTAAKSRLNLPQVKKITIHSQLM